MCVEKYKGVISSKYRCFILRAFNHPHLQDFDTQLLLLLLYFLNCFTKALLELMSVTDGGLHGAISPTWRDLDDIKC